MISSKITEAILFAYDAHKDQKRNDGKPFIIHPLSVGYILSSLECSEEVIIAGILHDVIEDTIFTAKNIEEKFGKRVTALVLEVTQDATISDWSMRKKAYRDHLSRASMDACLISLADLLDNRRSILDALKEGIDIWKTFGGNEKQVMEDSYERLAIYKNAFDNQATKELEEILNALKKVLL